MDYSDESIASRLYANTTGAATTPAAASNPAASAAPAASAQAPEPQAKTREQLAEHLYERDKAQNVEVPESIQALRQDQERRLYEADRIMATLKPETWFGGNRAMSREACEMALDVGMTVDDLGEFVGVMRGLESLPTPETKASWQGQAEKALISEYGSQAGEMLELASRLAQRDPRWAAILEHTGLGSHPAVVSRFARLAQRERQKGRL